jgi:hypothetical protein
VAAGHDKAVAPELRPFFYLPYEHSELLADHRMGHQHRAVRSAAEGHRRRRQPQMGHRPPRHHRPLRSLSRTGTRRWAMVQKSGCFNDGGRSSATGVQLGQGQEAADVLGRGLIGGRVGGLVGGIKTKKLEANTVLSLTNVRTTETMAVQEGYAAKKIGWGAGGGWGFGGAVGGGYEDTEIGRIITLSLWIVDDDPRPSCRTTKLIRALPAGPDSPWVLNKVGP